jgi:hypothetical protein
MAKRRELKTILHDDAIYFAGLFDGEGCVNICERPAHSGGPGQVTPTFRCELSLANTHHGVLVHLTRTIGGIIFNPVRATPMKNGLPRSPCWRWSASQRESNHILQQIHPFLIVKKKQALVALEYYRAVSEFFNHPHPKRIGKLRLPPEELERRRNFLHQMQALNHRKSLILSPK